MREQRSSERARMRRLRAQYRKRTAIVGIILLIIGIVLGFVADRTLFNRQDTTAPVVVDVAPTPSAQEDLSGLGTFGDDFGDDFPEVGNDADAQGEDYTIAMQAPTEAPTPTPEPTETPTPTPEPTPEPTPTPVPGPTTVAVVPFGESYEFSTQINSDGTARISANPDEPFETVNFTMTMKDYMLPSDFAEKWGKVYKLQGTEAGAGFELTLNNYTGTTTITPQNIIKIAFVSESGETEDLGFQLMDAEIAGNLEVTLETNVPKILWKRYTFTNAGEEMKYLAVSTYRNGATETILFELKSNVAPTPDPLEQYTTLTRGDKKDGVTDLQKRLIELGYLSGKADGNYGSKTQEAVRKAQKDFGMDETGTATPEFQLRLFADEAEEADAEAADAEEADAEEGDEE